VLPKYVTSDVMALPVLKLEIVGSNSVDVLKNLFYFCCYGCV